MQRKREANDLPRIAAVEAVGRAVGDGCPEAVAALQACDAARATVEKLCHERLPRLQQELLARIDYSQEEPEILEGDGGASALREFAMR